MIFFGCCSIAYNWFLLFWLYRLTPAFVRPISIFFYYSIDFSWYFFVLFCCVGRMFDSRYAPHSCGTTRLWVFSIVMLVTIFADSHRSNFLVDWKEPERRSMEEIIVEWEKGIEWCVAIPFLIQFIFQSNCWFITCYPLNVWKSDGHCYQHSNMHFPLCVRMHLNLMENSSRNRISQFIRDKTMSRQSARMQQSKL